MIEANPKKIEIKIADEMAETGCLGYRIKKKNNKASIIIKPRHIEKSDNKDRGNERCRSKVATVNEITPYNR